MRVRDMSRRQQKAVFANLGNPSTLQGTGSSAGSQSDRDKILAKEFPQKPGLNYSASILVPSTWKDKPVPKKEFKARIKETKNFLNDSFGGSTTIRSIGSYTDSKGEIINEDIVIVTAHTDKKGYRKGSRKVEGFLKNKRSVWKQESMGYIFESPAKPSKSFHFIEK